MKKFFKSFKYAAHGVAEACKQRNFRFHICAMAFVIFFAARFYDFSAERWAILLLTCAGMLALETVNTALERLADKVTEERSHRIRIAKDCAAGAVLLWAVFAVAVGVLLFWDIDRFRLIGLYFSDFSRLALLILCLALAWGFVFLPEYRKKNDK